MKCKQLQAAPIFYDQPRHGGGGHGHIPSPVGIAPVLACITREAVSDTNISIAIRSTSQACFKETINFIFYRKKIQKRIRKYQM